MAQDVEPARRGNSRGKRARVVGIDDAQRRLQIAMGDAGFRTFFDVVENRHAGRFAPRSGRRRNGDQRFERPRDGQALADRRVDEVEKVGIVRRIEIGRLGRVDRAAAPNGEERIEPAAAGKGSRLVKARVRRLNDDSIVNLEIDAGRLAATKAPSLPSACRGGPDRSAASVRRTPRSTRSSPTSRVIPVPNRRFEAAN